MRRLFGLSITLLLAASCVSPAGETSPTTTIPPAPTTSAAQPTTTSDPGTTTSAGSPVEPAWTEEEAEKHVSNYLAALSAGAYEQAAFSAHQNGIVANGQRSEEAFAEFLARMCGDFACAGPYEVEAAGPGVLDADSSQASSIVQVTHVDSGTEGSIRLFTFEGDLVITDLPPLVASQPEPTIVARLFGSNPPDLVVVERFDAFQIWDEGEVTWVTNWFANGVSGIERGIALVSSPRLGHNGAVELLDPSTTYATQCPRLMERGGEAVAHNQCTVDRWDLVEVRTGVELAAPIDYESGQDGEAPWLDERGGMVVQGTYDAEGNLIELANLDGTDLLGPNYAGVSRLSTDGRHMAYVDHADQAATSHFFSPVVVVVDTATGSEVGRWILDGDVICLEFAVDWVIACEASGDSELEPSQEALAAMNITTGEVNRVESMTRVFLPTA